jgi:hypothetical protein
VPAGVAPYPGVADGSYLQRPKYDPRPSRAVSIYALVQFAIATLATAAIMFTQEDAPRPLLAAGGALVILTLSTCAGLLENKRWAKPVEAARLALVVVLASSWRSLSA